MDVQRLADHIQSLANHELKHLIDYGLTVEFEKQGVDGNYCLWPFNFDPRWLKRCTGFMEVI
jgi:hypothetical protein